MKAQVLEPEEVVEFVPQILNLKKILVPIDFSDMSKQAFQYALRFAEQFRCEIVLLHVVEPETVIAGTPLPSKYAALGGFGPYGCDADSVVVQPTGPPEDYPLGGPKRIVAIQGDTIISGHGAVTGPATAWMLLDQVKS